MKYIYSILLLLAAQSLIYSQTLHIYDVDTDNYPLMKAKFFVTDSDNIQLKSLVPAEFRIYENQIEKFVKDISCDPEPILNKISTVLTIDVSGSMNGSRLEWVKSAGKQWIEEMDSLNEETAITTFDDEALLYSDFRIKKSLLLNSLASLEIRNGTNYKNAFLDPYAGALDVARRAKYKPIIIFLTDGVGLTDFKSSDIIKQAENLNAVIYAISIDISLPVEMREIAEATGGQYFEKIDSREKLEEIYSLIRKVVVNTSPCEISWYTEGCLLGREAEFNFIPLKLKKKLSFDTPGDVFPEFEIVNDQFATFECSKPSEYIYKLKAKNGEIIVNGVIKKNGNESCFDFSVNVINRNTPFILKKDSILEVRVRYNPTNNDYKFCEFEVDASTCRNNELYAIANCLDSPPTNILLNVKRPNGGEVFKANTIERVFWNGTSKDSDLIVEYSLDSGSSWNYINDGKLTNSSIWNVPNTESSNCLVKVKQMSSDAGRKIYDTSIDSSNVLAISWNKRGNLFAIVSDTNSIKLFNSITGKKVDEIFHLTDNSKIKDVHFLPDGARLFVSNENGLYILNLLNKKFEFIDSLIGEIEISDDETILTICNPDSVVVLDLQTRKTLKTINRLLPNDVITDVAISNDSRTIAVSDSNDNKESVIRIFEKSNNWFVTTDKTLTNLGLDYSYSNIDWSFDDSFLFSNSWVNTTQFLDIWDLNTNSKIVRTPNPSTSEISDLKASHIDNLLVQIDRDFKVIVWEIQKNVDKYEFVELYNFTSTVIRNNTIEWSPDATRFAIGNSGSKTSKLLSVYSVKSYPTVEDISDSVFTIVKNIFNIQPINLGTTIISQTKDSTISNLLEYNYEYPFQVDSVVFTGIDKSSFALSNSPNLPTFASLSIQPNFNFSFTPFKVGEHNASLSIYTQYGVKTIDIVGKGVKPLIGLENYNFGEVLVTKDSIIAKESIINNGTSDLVINKIRVVGPADESFSITDINENNLDDLNNLILSPNQKLELYIKFSPLLPEILNARVEIEYVNEFNNIDFKYIKLYGEGINPELNSPDIISFKPTQCNEITTEEVTIYNVGNGSLTISDIILSSTNFKLLDNFNFKLELEENDSLKFRIEFDPIDEGILRDSILIFTNQINTPIIKIYLNGRKLSTSYSIEGNYRLLGVDDNIQIDELFRIINDGKTDLEWSFPYNSPDGKIEILSIDPNPTLPGDTSLVKYRFYGGEKGEVFNFTFAPEPLCSDSIKVEIEVKNTNPTLSTDFETNYHLVCEDTLLFKIPITNIGEVELKIENIRFENGNNSNFITNKKIINLQESESDTLLITFIATISGVYETDLVIISNDSKSTDGKYTKRLIIKKDKSQFDITDDSIDFQFIGLNNPGNKTFEIMNNGTIPIRWRLLPINNFNIISVVPLVADPGEVSIVTLVYTGPNDLSSNYNLFISDSCGNLDSIMLNVLTSNTASAIVRISKEKRKIGEIFDFQLELKNANKLADAGVTKITGELVFNHSLMIPNGVSSTIVNGNRFVPFEISDLQSGSITTIEMKTLWGNDSCSLVSINELVANGNTTTINLEQEIGSICITDLCYEGGIRLLDLSVELGANLKINNNSNKSLDLELTLIENGLTSISIIDLHGKTVNSKEYNDLKVGYNIINNDISGISDGIYFVEIRTPSITLYKKLVVIR